MSFDPMRCAIVASTGGSVMNELLKNRFFRKNIVVVISDRQCPAVDKAKVHGVKSEIIAENDKYKFCDRLLKCLQDQNIDYVISFFTKLFVGELLEVYQDRIINLHPSLLPAFKGMNGFGDAVDFGVRYIGSTIHFIDHNMDEGKIIMQTIYPCDATGDLTYLRHKLFEQQCKSLLQVTKWLADRRVRLEGNKVIVQHAKFTGFNYSPNLDFEDAIRLDLPYSSNI